jgi:hypothetical protein
MVDPGFHSKVCQRLEMVLSAQDWRRRKYGEDAAEEYAMGHTPTELVKKREAEVERILEAWAAPSPPSPLSDSSRGKGELLPKKPRDRAQAGQPQPLATPSPSDVDRNDTPASSDAPDATVRRRKRRLSGEPVDADLASGPRKKRRLREAVAAG